MSNLTSPIGDDPGGGPDNSNEAYVLAAYESNFNARRLVVALLTLVVWEFAITIDDMAELFLNASWNTVKTMYIINRFATPFTITINLLILATPSPSIFLCNVAPWLEIIATLILLILIGVTMTIRVYALWNRDKRVLTSVVTLLVLHITTYGVLISYAAIEGSMKPARPPFTGCVAQSEFDKMWALPLPVLVFETVVISLIVYKTWFFATQGDLRTPLYTMLFLDGLIYYLAILASQAVILVCFIAPSFLTDWVAQSFFAFTVIGVACNRLLARLQRLLLGKGKGQSGFSTIDAWSSVAPELMHGGGGRDEEPSTGLPYTLKGPVFPLEAMRNGYPSTSTNTGTSMIK